MAHTEVLLLKPIDGLGGEGDLVRVRAGYARNYLLLQQFAVPVTQANRRHIESLKSRRVERESKELVGARELAERLKGVAVAFAVKTGEGGKMFGSVTQGDLHTKLTEQGYIVDKKRVHIAGGHVKTLGKHEASIKLHPEVTVEISFEVVSENPIVEAPKAADAAPALDKDGKPRKPRRDRPESSEAPRERKSAVEMLLDSLGEAPASEKPTAAGDDKKAKGGKKKKKKE
ncbi:MAG TPA: 50S ribosomal protein L9 [Opitutales bacterium]|nr:50S ribosomal protein L9 [Opitutales bacterium]